MKKAFLFLAILPLFFACDKEESGACISNCNSSIPGQINIAIEDHTNLNLSNVILTINGQASVFSLISKATTGNYSCWKSFPEVTSITSIEFNVGDASNYSEIVNYQNLSNSREYSIDIRNVNDEFRVQLVQSPDCISDAD